jgi:ubiquinone/menaquinone biosynthesis C-methylase UbiE
MNKDKLEELNRYDALAQSMLHSSRIAMLANEFGSGAMPEYLRTPYIFYEKCVKDLISPQKLVLELGAGMGLNTWTLVQTGAIVTATDISQKALEVLEQRILNLGGQVRIKLADIEALPFPDNSFDVVVCAGSLSYGEPVLVNKEIRRVLRSGGMFICVDSLNHNPIYCANRWLHYLRGNRSKNTLKRVPNLPRIKDLSEGFCNVNVRFFGSMSYAMPVIARLFGENTARAASERIDQLVGVRRSAFKFVLVAQGFECV